MVRKHHDKNAGRMGLGCKLIVHADDFGLSEKINQGILLAHQKGILTSTSIMAVGPAFEHAITMSRLTPTLDIGVHLTLVGARPLSAAHEVKSLLDQTGSFFCHAKEFSKHFLMGRINLHEVRREMEAQIKRVVNSGISISHIDSHQHVHMLPKIFAVVCELANDYDIRVVRFPYEKLDWEMFVRLPSVERILQLLILNAFCYYTAKKYKKLLHTDHFAGFLFGGNLNKRNLRLILEKLFHSGSFELMCHPGLNDLQSHYLHWNYKWEDELEALLDENIHHLIEERGIRLISYHDFLEKPNSF